MDTKLRERKFIASTEAPFFLDRTALNEWLEMFEKINDHPRSDLVDFSVKMHSVGGNYYEAYATMYLKSLDSIMDLINEVYGCGGDAETLIEAFNEVKIVRY